MDCTFISIQSDETIDDSTKEQLSIILRFDRKGEIVERFIKFKLVFDSSFPLNANSCFDR